jgi:hypothetical protein
MTEWYESSKWDTELYADGSDDDYEDSPDYDRAVEERLEGWN